jgi:hypothetical protein
MLRAALHSLSCTTQDRLANRELEDPARLIPCNSQTEGSHRPRVQGGHICTRLNPASYSGLLETRRRFKPTGPMSPHKTM